MTTSDKWCSVLCYVHIRLSHVTCCSVVVEVFLTCSFKKLFLKSTENWHILFRRNLKKDEIKTYDWSWECWKKLRQLSALLLYIWSEHWATIILGDKMTVRILRATSCNHIVLSGQNLLSYTEAGNSLAAAAWELKTIPWSKHVNLEKDIPI